MLNSLACSYVQSGVSAFPIVYDTHDVIVFVHVKYSKKKTNICAIGYMERHKSVFLLGNRVVEELVVDKYYVKRNYSKIRVGDCAAAKNVKF